MEGVGRPEEEKERERRIERYVDGEDRKRGMERRGRPGEGWACQLVDILNGKLPRPRLQPATYPLWIERDEYIERV